MDLTAHSKNTAFRILWQREAAQDATPRAHLGYSILGRPCERELWLSFRWVTLPKHSGRLLRLFDRGQNEEAVFIDELKALGCEVHGEQERFIGYKGHAGGSMDGAALGLPESPDKWHVLEFKTHNDKSFKQLALKGVEEAKPEHYAQMQCYMHESGMERALYLAVNKNDDYLYSEQVKYKKSVAEKLMKKAARIIDAPEPPERISNDPSWYQCKFCDHYANCQQKELPAINCRTCAHSTPVEGGKWHCQLKDKLLTGMKPCVDHVVLPQIMPWEVKEMRGEQNQIEYVNGVINGTNATASVDL